jgi:Family of unknown function (DUF6328)
VSAQQPAPEQRWDPSRDETETERLDRNWNSLLQELRVAQTGTQVLTGFLMTLPFQQRFSGLTTGARTVYLATVGCSIAATVLLVAPVSAHRLLFRRHRLDVLVKTSHTYARAGLLLLSFAMTGVAYVVFDAVVGVAGAWAAALVTALALAVFWLALPLRERRVKRGNRPGL